MKLALMKCIEDVIITGRNEDGSADHCFIGGKDYLFCVDEKKKKVDIFTFNEVKEVHFLKLLDDFSYKHFDLLKMDELDNFDLDEFTKAKYQKLFKERYEYSE